ncbi:choice-of-anchor D domain-containing protein [Pseudohoeflea suaedae]|uniref:DUF7933 domain-containing protein n=1 Tax=Pseudohoeflea suaedae TaxID=877384 RepID=UPI001304BA8C|nr:choice-of-anchor D domain-containing protein [Pseudohoeflea suaedae]
MVQLDGAITCGTAYNSTDEIEILNNGIVSGSTIQVLIAFYNGATGSVTGGTTSDDSGTFLSPECNVTVGCTLSVTGTYSGTPFAFSVVFPGANSTTATLSNTNYGAATAPEISVSETGQNQGAVADEGTLAQGTQAAGSPVNLTFTVTNSGTGDLTIATATSSLLSNVTVNSISAPTNTTVASGGGTETFTVQYTPTSAGNFSFNLSFANDDANEGPYNFIVSGTASGAPEISVAETGQSQGAVADEGTLAQGTQAAGSPVNLTFTVTNSGTGDLTIATATSSLLSNVTVNSISAPTNSTVASGGGTETFTVQYTPTSAGNFSFNLSFVNDDANESPYNFTISGTGTAAPTFSQSFSPTTIEIGGASTITFTIDNSTNALDATSLDFTDNLPAGMNVSSPSNAATTCTGGTLTASSGAGTVSYSGGTVGAGASCTVSVDVGATSDGSFVNTTGNLTSSLGNSGPSSASLTVSSPDIDVQRPVSTSIADDDIDSQGVVTLGVQQTLTFTIENKGTATLSLSGTPTSDSPINVSVDSISAPGSNTLAGGATTTFTVQYTPIAIGPFSFQVDIVSNDADEANYDILVSGTASGAAEIEVSSSASGPISDGGTDTISGTVTAGSSATITYTITNSGTAPLSLTQPTVGGNVTSTTNVTVDSFTLSSLSVVSGGGTATLQVSYTPTSSGSFDFDFNFANNDADENPFNISVSGTGGGIPAGLSATSGSGQSTEAGTQFGSVLVATVTDSSNAGVAGVSVTFTAPSSGASLTFAGSGSNTETVITASDGTATSSAMTANAIASGYSGGSLQSYAVTASAAGLTSVDFFLTNSRDSAADIQRTEDVIASFVTSRANVIVAGQPDLVSRLTNGPFGRQSGLNGFNFNASRFSQTGSFQFSLRAFSDAVRNGVSGSPVHQPVTAAGHAAGFDSFTSETTSGYASAAPQAAEAETLAILGIAAGQAPAAGEESAEVQSGWDFWAEGTYARTQDKASDSVSGLFFAGLDYRFADRAVVGVLGQLDITDEHNGSANTSADGIGWMVGPYAVLKVHQNFYIDGAVTYGQSNNSVNALGLFEDDFRTQRFLMQGGLTGDFEIDEHARISPFVRLTYYYEEQESYTDSLGNQIPSQDFDLGRVEFGPKISWELILDDSLLFSPFVSLSGIYDFNKLHETVPTDPRLASSDEDLRARLEMGAGIVIPNRKIRISGKGFYDGIGAADFSSYGGTLNFTVPF